MLNQKVVIFFSLVQNSTRIKFTYEVRSPFSNTGHPLKLGFDPLPANTAIGVLYYMYALSKQKNRIP